MTLLTAEPPSTVAQSTTWSIGGPADLCRARQAAFDLVTDHERDVAWPGPSTHRVPVLLQVRERVALVVTELVTNALRHAQQPVSVALSRSASGWVVCVEDGGGRLAPHVRAATPNGGHGLNLVLLLARRSGWAAAGTGRRVWADIGDDPPEELLERLQGTAHARD